MKTVSWGSETLAHLGPKLWSIIPEDMKQILLSKFTQKIRKWRPENALVDYAKRTSRVLDSFPSVMPHD